MAFSHGKGAVFKVDDTAGTLRDISANVGNVDFGRDLDAAETTTFGNNDRTFIVGLRTATFSTSGFFDSATNLSDVVLSGLMAAHPTGGTATFEYGPEGGAAGKIKYTGESILTNYSIGSPVDGVVSFTADFQVSGAITRTTF